ncbi:hypothetical protein RJ639_039288, partial [Escallonia herrerae]
RGSEERGGVRAEREMGRAPCCEGKEGLKKGPWAPEEDELLVEYIKKHGHGSWRSLPKLAGLLRCGKSCRLRWTNYLRPDIKRGSFSDEEEKIVIQLHGMLGNSVGFTDFLLESTLNSMPVSAGFCILVPAVITFGFTSINMPIFRWAVIASQLPGRTDNEIKNLWNSHLKKRLLCMGIDPETHEAFTTSYGPFNKLPASASTRHMAQWESARLEAEARLSKDSSLLIPTSYGRTDDYFLRIWNSEVGDSFRKFSRGDKTACESPVSQTSSSTKCGSVSGTTTEIGLVVAAASAAESNQNEDGQCRSNMFPTDYFMAGSDSSSSTDMEDESGTALQLLLDFPSNNDMSFLEGHTDAYAAYPAILTRGS